MYRSKEIDVAGKSSMLVVVKSVGAAERILVSVAHFLGSVTCPYS